MNFRLAAMEDLPQLKQVYQDIIRNMDNHQICIWDDIYPCAFFEEDIKNDCLYVLFDQKELVSAFALHNTSPGEKAVEWQENKGKACYLDRFGVNVNYLKKGIGSWMLQKAKETAKESGAACLRLFAVDINEPAIALYKKNGFIKGKGVYDEIIDEDFILHEYGFEAVL